ncbi:unnamed protein product, partial [marine sediment metagenome]
METLLMVRKRSRRELLTQVGAAGVVAAAGITLPAGCDAKPAAPDEPRASARAAPRVVIARDDKLTRGKVNEHRELLRKLLDAAMQKLTKAPDAATAWRQMFRPGDRVGIKVNTLGLSTQPAVVDAVVAGLRQADVAAGKIIIWDRLDVELRAAGFKTNKPSRGVQCRGTDSEQRGSGYQRQVETS